MKSLLFALSLMSFVVYKAAKVEVNLQGIWKGSYRTAAKTAEVEIVFESNNRIQLYSNDIKKAGKATGSYLISNNNEIAITCHWPGEDSNSITMNGRLSLKKDAVDGIWVSDDHSSGSFYLAKAGQK